ncbi:dynamin family protein [Cohnella thailandensis]|uniref:Dynamin family protein n=2 Tax=Cohnella thailandensis TaxID=557557 RepID=A0A841SWZ4_9BACL|nr:dynamin family protein [Cohnella thailandensis]MBB6636773.1 dynamin family protein [Cohnella thailandensis]MBP1973350.1 GTPase Era involved in 16S rRNA processing [Cohnella thailandensis]
MTRQGTDTQWIELSTYGDALRRMGEQAGAAGDEIQRDKFGELADKLDRGLLTIAFCGHFSAGKSTLVNALMGAQLLPSSPIPTTANVVTVRDGEPGAHVLFRSKDGRIAETPNLPVERLNDLAIDGEGVASIDVTYPVPLLRGGLALVDTPGVDSTDGAHRAATESALHLADVVFFVSDYNHVLSEVNFRFMRTLHRWGKPTYLIVNMIDKHREEEVSFSAFREGLRQAMGNWRIEPAGILFLSLRVPEHPLSQWEELNSVIEGLKPLREPLMLRSARRSAVYLAEQFREHLKQGHSQQRDRLAEQAGGLDEIARLAEARQELEKRLEELENEGENRLLLFRDRLDRLLSNASLTPAETRERAREVLESLQSGFKAGGWFGGAAKTEAERERRLRELVRDLNGQLAANVHGHVAELLRQDAKEIGQDGEALEAQLEKLLPDVTAEWIRSQVKPGASADGQATLHFSSELSSSLKAQVRKEALRLASELDELRKPAREETRKRLTAELRELSSGEEAAAQLAALEEEELQAERRLLNLLPEAPGVAGTALPAVHELGGEQMDRHADWMRAAEAPGSVEAQSEDTGAAAASPAQDEAETAYIGAQQGAAELLEQAAGLLAPFPTLMKQAEGLKAKAERFRDNRFTIALFGAFSAGKSSFANALVGMPALPVSPNPTTATINRIVPPSEGYPHGTALIRMKTAEAMQEDVAHSLGRVGIGSEEIAKAGDDIAALLKLAARMSPDELHPKGRPHLAFLRAAESGWSRYGGKLGLELKAEEEEYRRFVAEEEASCFVASADLHIDSPLTRSGAVLVDTPGADSINARHTGVAFQYIKDADAVLFVTYYNHAFTEADRSFLHQLGSVKDVFELDKMFFIINAADLASSQEELDSVARHVETQLLKHGIRKPRLYPVSSLNGLKAKRERSPAALQSSGLAAFEKAFRHFSEEELGGLAVASAQKELERIDGLLSKLLESANEDTATREARKQRMLEEARQLRSRMESSKNDAAVQPILQEMGDQLYHSRQRVKYRFNEHFMAAFHPSVLQDDGRDLKKLLPACWADLQRSVGEDLLQELRSAGLRMENALHKLVSARISEEAAEAALDGFVPEAPARSKLELPLGEPFPTALNVDAKRLWNAFRSPKHFFEKNAKAALRDELEAELFREADRWLEQVKRQWSEATGEAFRADSARAAEGLASELTAFAQGLEETLGEAGDELKLAALQEQWRKIRLSASGTPNAHENDS